LCQAYNQLPSDVFGIDDAWAAWDFNHAVLTFGRYVGNELDKCKDQNARDRRIHDLLGIPRKPKPININALMGMQGITVQRGS